MSKESGKTGKGGWIGVLSVALIAMLMWLAVPKVAIGWADWDGVDPVIAIGNNHTLSVRIEWPSNFTCTIRPPIKVKVAVPKGVNASLVSESSEQFKCRTITTATSISQSGKAPNQVKVEVELEANAKGVDFPVRVILTLDGNQTVIEGTENKEITGTLGL